METLTEKSIDILNDLLQVNNDRIEGYKHAAKETNEPDLKDLFAKFVEDSNKFKMELTTEVKNLGGTPVEGTRNTGKIYRVWMDVKAALTNKDRKAILNSCDTGEGVAIGYYVDALEDLDTSSSYYSLIKKQFEIIKEDRVKIKNLLDAVAVA
jgi:uncharacterized protein (TIGR02284 family)